MQSETYSSAGVDIDANNQANRLIGELARSTLRPEVLSGVGFFGGMYEFKGYNQPVLVSSTDSVGTKVKIAVAMGKHDTVGMDIVNHCVNDIFTSGAAPLFFLDYIGIGKMLPQMVAEIVKGLADACREVGCVLIGGETAELSDVYHPGEYDLVGTIVGVVEKENIVMGKASAVGDAIIGLPSSGLHTNGYTLARKVLGDTPEKLKKHYDELGRSAGEALLEPHVCYFNQLKDKMSHVKGLAHITGGGLIDNFPRVLPDGLGARFDSKSWDVLPIFSLIQKMGNVARDEMYRVFNMGIGMTVVCAPEHAVALAAELPGASIIGEVIKQAGDTRVIIE